MWSFTRMGFHSVLLLLLLLLLFLMPHMGLAQLSSSSDSDGLESTPSIFNLSSTGEEELASMQITSEGPSPKVVAKKAEEEEAAEEEEEEEEDWSMPENYLYTGNASALSSSSCRRPFQLSPQPGTFPPDLRPLLRQAAVSLTNAANFLNLIFQASELRETSVREDIEWYHALVRGMLEGDRPGLVRRALLTFDADPTAPQPQLVLRASRGPSQDIYLQDLTLTWESLISPPSGHSWFTSLKSSSPPLPGLSKRVLLNDLSTLDTPKWARGDSYITNSSGLRWGEMPFLECEDGHYLPGWLLTLSIPFYGLKPDLSPEFRGVVRVDVNIQGFDVDQCASGNVWFADTHQCNRTTMECDPIPRQGFRLGQYCCRCKEGYYSPTSDYKNKMSAGSNSTRACYPNLPVCLPCWPGCKECKDNSPCWVQEDWLLRAVVLAVQGIFMVLVLLSMLRAYQCRRTKRIRASGLFLLEMILFGSLLLYFPVFILYFKPSTFRCILLRWVRLLGFAIVYGTVTLKMYRVLKVFLSRTAQRVPYMSSTTVLKMLGVMVLTVSWFLCAWTAGVLQNRDRNVPVLITSTTSDGQGFHVCDLDRWDYMMAVAELLFLCWGSFLCNAVKAVPSAFHEPRYMGIAIHNELLISAMFHLFRFARPSLHPDWMLLLFFTHTHVTITVTLGLLFLPKFLYISRPVKEEIAAEVYEDEVDLRRSCSYLNSSFTSTCWSDHSLDPDDIRDELKKLYAQLEVHKTKKMANNNPHLQKKRSSRLTLGRSLIKRIAEIPESLSRQCSREEKDISGAGGMRKWSGAFMSTPDSASIKNETVKLPSPKMRKSLSAYEYYPEKDSSRKSSMRNSVDKRSSHISEAESVDTALLICKSASAHNLAVDNNLLQPVSTRFQKSLSFTEKHRDHYPLCPTRSMEDASLATKASPVEKVQRPQGSIKEQTSNALLCLSFDKSEVCPWEVEEEQPVGKNLSNQKHVTYSLSQEQPAVPETASSPTRLFVCPWEGLPPPPPPVGEGGNVEEADVDSPRPKPPISSSAPGSPHGFAKPKDHRGFSFRSATQSLLVVRGLGKGSGKDKSKSETSTKEDTLQQTRATSMKLTPGTAASSSRRTPQTPRRAMTTVETKPCLVKQEAIRLSSYDSPERSPKGSAPTHICPWESNEIVMEVKKQNPYDGIIQKQGSKHRLSLTLSTDSNKSSLLHIRPSLTIPKAEVCPWDVPNQPQLVHQQSSIANICPWEVEGSDQLQAKDTRGDVCPWEADDKEPQMAKEKKALLNICPWESSEVTSSTGHKSMEGLEQRRSSMKADVCPWDAPDTSTYQVKQDYVKPTSEAIKPTERVIYVNTHSNESPSDKMYPGKQEKISTDVCPWETNEAQMHQESTRVNVCPWESDDITIKDTETIKVTDTVSKTKTRLLTKQLTSNAEACPWDHIESSQSDARGPEGQESVCSNICPLETEETPKNDAEEQPREAVPIKKNLLTNQKTNTAETCPCDVPKSTPTVTESQGASSNLSKETTEITSQDSTNKSAHVCPWEIEQSERTEGIGCIKTMKRKKSLLKQENKHADVCPWETSEPVRKQEVASTEVSPWETSEQARKQETSSSEVCKWETGEQVRKPGTGSSEVCPWESSEPVTKQEVAPTEVCPWKTGGQVRKQETSSSEACSWETSEQVRSQEAGSSMVCPWETGQERKQEVAPSEVGPWKTGRSETGQSVKCYQKQGSIHTNVCPWELSESEKPIQKPQSVCDNICPWETEGSSKLTSSQDKSQADVHPQKPEELEMQGVCADVASAVPVYAEVSGDQSVSEIIQTDAPLSADSGLQTPQGARAIRPLTRCDALCPWDVEGEPQASMIEHDNNSDVFTWEEPIPEEDEGDAETAAEAFIFPPDL